MLHSKHSNGKHTRRNFIVGAFSLTGGALLMNNTSLSVSDLMGSNLKGSHEGNDARELQASIHNDSEEIKQRIELHKILTHPEQNHWHNIVQLKDDVPFKISGKTEFFKTNVPDLIVIFHTDTKKIQLATQKQKDGSDLIILATADFPGSK